MAHDGERQSLVCAGAREPGVGARVPEAPGQAQLLDPGAPEGGIPLSDAHGVPDPQHGPLGVRVKGLPAPLALSSWRVSPSRCLRD